MRLAARTLLLLAAALPLAGCGSVSGPGGTDATATTAPDLLDIVEEGEELVAHGMIMQATPDAPVEICVGGIADSLPPQCGGPQLKGDFSWDDVSPERAAGVTWAERIWAVGTYDPADGADGSFTLTRPVSTEPPQEYTPPAEDGTPFPQLCEDPFRGGQEGYADLAAQEDLQAGLEGLDGYVTSWVSDGSSLFNVVVTEDTDPEEVHARLREVWRGGLCVEARDLPSQEDLRAAQEALSPRFTELGLLHSGWGVSGLLEVGVVVTDRATVDAVHDTVSPWLAPGQVVISGALQPLRSG